MSNSWEHTRTSTSMPFENSKTHEYGYEYTHE